MTQQVIWNLPAPLDEEALASRGPEPTLVQFAGGVAPSESDHRMLGAFMKTHPATTVRLYGDHLSPDLGWLGHYAAARRVSLDVNDIVSFEALHALRPDLEQLTLGPSTKRRLSLAPLRHFERLRALTIVGHQTNIDVVGELLTLERLTLISVRLRGLAVFETLTALRAFELKLGGTTDLSALPQIGQLQYVEVWRVNGLADLGVVAKLPHIEYLFLQHLKRVEHLPSLASCRRLRRLHLDRVGLHDLRPIADAPGLEELLLLDMPQLDLDAFRPLIDHPTLRAVTAGVRNESRREEIRRLLCKDDVQTHGTDFQFTPTSQSV